MTYMRVAAREHKMKVIEIGHQIRLAAGSTIKRLDREGGTMVLIPVIGERDGYKEVIRLTLEEAQALHEALTVGLAQPGKPSAEVLDP